MTELIEKTALLRDSCENLELSGNFYVYNPLSYAWSNHIAFLNKYIEKGARAIFLGMNPGPFGMMQTGVPFGEVNFVKNYLKLSENIEKPNREHPSRPVLGMDCKRSEVSGKRIWSLVSEHYPNADFAGDMAFFNYCPLGFIDSGKTGKNITPDKLEKNQRLELESICDSYLNDVINIVKPEMLIGVGKYAEGKLRSVSNLPVFSIIHPSPGNPQANDNWSGKAEEKLREIGLWN